MGLPGHQNFRHSVKKIFFNVCGVLLACVSIHYVFKESRTRVTESSEGWEPEPCSLEKQHVLLTAKMSLASNRLFFTGDTVTMSSACLT